MFDRKILIVGGTGMLAPLCDALPPEELIVAARLRNNLDKIAEFNPTVFLQELDYQAEKSIEEFMISFLKWEHLKYCILWVHSPWHEFCRLLMKAAQERDNPPAFITVFGMESSPDALKDYADSLDIQFSSVRLGRVQTVYGDRWMTHHEISAETAKYLENDYPNLLEKIV